MSNYFWYAQDRQRRDKALREAAQYRLASLAQPVKTRRSYRRFATKLFAGLIRAFQHPKHNIDFAARRQQIQTVSYQDK